MNMLDTLHCNSEDESKNTAKVVDLDWQEEGSRNIGKTGRSYQGLWVTKESCAGLFLSQPIMLKKIQRWFLSRSGQALHPPRDVPDH